MIFEQIKTGGDRNFAYLIGDEKSAKVAVVDPSNSPELVLARAEAQGVNVAYLINTHGHYDHTDGNDHVLSETNAELISPGDGEKISLGDVTLTFIHTPGHTADSICILAEQSGETAMLVTGDTLFVGKVGGTGYGKDARDEYNSLHEKLMTLPEETEVWPGHDYGTAPTSTIGNEKKTNPFLLRETFDAFVDLKRNWAAYKKENNID